MWPFVGAVFAILRNTTDHGCSWSLFFSTHILANFFVLMPTAPEGKLSHHGRIMKCVTFLLLLPETLKKVKRTSKHPGRLSLCYNILTLSLKKRMAAELYPVNDHATVQKNGTVMLSLPEKKRSVGPVAQSTACIATTPTTEQNINNNNVEIPSWHSAHPTLRERQGIQINWRIKFWDVYLTSNLTFF